MITTGIERILISVRDMNESLEFYRDWVGMKVVADQKLDQGAIQRLWDLTAGTEARAVFLKNDEQATMLELIEFQPNSGKAISEGATTWDYGLYDIAFQVRDLDKTYQDLINRGYTFLSPPVFYSPDWVPFDVKETILIGPNEMPIAHIEILTSPKPELAGDYGMMVDSAQIVEDMDEAMRFYRDILGLRLEDDCNLPRGLVDEVLQLPPDTDVRIAFFNKEGSNAPLVEFLTYSLKGKSLAPVAKPPNTGLFMISFETDDLSGLIKTFTRKEIRIVSRPVEMELAPYGKIEMIIVEGPSKAKIEFFEKK